MGLANLLLDTGRAEESLPLYRDLCSRLEAAFGPDASALPMTNEAIALSYAGRPEEALTLFRRVMDMHHAGDDGFIHHRVAEAQRRLGRPADALAEDRVALATGERFMHADDPALMPSLLGIGNDLLLLGRAREALPPLERAVTIGDKLRQPGELAEFHFALAQALWEAGGDRARARKLAARAAEEARPEAERYGRRFQTQLDDIERWVAAHR
jgi:tetratricopeptide (TPR) repeat protein